VGLALHPLEPGFQQGDEPNNPLLKIISPQPTANGGTSTMRLTLTAGLSSPVTERSVRGMDSTSHLTATGDQRERDSLNVKGVR